MDVITSISWTIVVYADACMGQITPHFDAMEETQVRTSSEQEMLSDVDGEQTAGCDQVRTANSPCDNSAMPATAWLYAVAGCTPAPKEIAKKAVLGAVIVVVWMTLAIPAVMFYLPQDSPSDSAAVNTADSNTCTETEVYRGVVCRKALQSVQQCISSDQSVDGPIFIPASGRQQKIETQAQTLISALPLLQPSQACEDAVVPLLCLYLFGVCSNDVNGTLHQPSSQQCSVIRSDTCASEWKMAETFLGRETLPDCTLLRDLNNPSDLDCTKFNSTEHNPANGNTTTTNVTCSDDFHFNGERCQPECGEWEEWSSTTVDTIDGFVILAVTIDMIASAITIVISCIQYKKMLKLPASLIVYQTLGLFVIGVIVLVGYMDRKTLFCSSRDLLKSYYNPTAFCTITGATFSYVIVQLLFWWFCHCVMVCWAIKFPFHYRSYQKTHSFKYIHTAVLVLGLVLPGVPVAVTFGTGEYVITRFPPVVCTPNSREAAFYALILPICILIAAGTSLLIMVFYEIVKVIKKKDRTRIVQAKILIVLVFYIIVGASSLTAFTVVVKQSSSFLDELTTYFVCEGAGTGEQCDRSGFMEYNNPIASAISYVTIGLVPVVNLVYVVKCWCTKPATRQEWNRHRHKACGSVSTRTGSKQQIGGQSVVTAE